MLMVTGRGATSHDMTSQSPFHPLSDRITERFRPARLDLPRHLSRSGTIAVGWAGARAVVLNAPSGYVPVGRNATGRRQDRLLLPCESERLCLDRGVPRLFAEPRLHDGQLRSPNQGAVREQLLAEG